MAITERDNQGRIIGKKLTSEEASRMARKRWDREKDKNARIEALLQEKGYDLDTAPESLLLWAEKAVGSGSGNVSAQARFDSWGEDRGSSIAINWDGFSPCPVCGHIPVDAELVSFYRVLYDWFKHYRRDPEGFARFLGKVFDKYPPEVKETSTAKQQNHAMLGRVATRQSVFNK